MYQDHFISIDDMLRRVQIFFQSFSPEKLGATENFVNRVNKDDEIKGGISDFFI